MTPEIKQRIDQIRHGIVPDGYKKTSSGIAPCDWIETHIGNIYTERKEPGNEQLPLLMVSIHSGVSDGEVDKEILPKKVKRIEDKSLYKRAASGDLVFNMMRAWQGAIGTVRTEGMVSPAYIVAKPNSMIAPLFMDYYMRTTRMIGTINRQSYGVTDFRKRLYWDSFAPISCTLPSVAEQQKIAEILATQDRIIELQQKKIDELQKLKKASLQKMFPRKGEKVPELRFKGFTGDWEQCKLGDLFSERSERSNGTEELLSVTISNGVIKQADSDKKNTASSDTSNYKVVYPQDLPYNSMRMWQGAEGVSSYHGIISPAYTVLVPKKDCHSPYFAQFFKKQDVLNVFTRYSQGLTSDTWNLKYPQLSEIIFMIPSKEEQIAISEFLGRIDSTIALHQRKLELEKQKKKALMQLLLTGIVRV